MSKQNQAQQIIETILVIAGVTAAVLTFAGPKGPFKGAVEDVVNMAIQNINPDFHWKVVSTSKCSATCGEGTQTQVVECQDARGDKVSDSKCNPGSKPPTNLICNVDCAAYGWSTGKWLECAPYCGEDRQQPRTVECVSSAGGPAVAESLCDAEEKPLTVRDCSDLACYQWRAGDWEDCSVPCGGGTQDRLYVCMQMNPTTGE